MRDVLRKIKESIRPEGVLIIVDLFESERRLLTPAWLKDNLLNVAAIGVSGSLRLVHNGRLNTLREVQAAWEAHGHHDI